MCTLDSGSRHREMDLFYFTCSTLVASQTILPEESTNNFVWFGKQNPATKSQVFIYNLLPFFLAGCCWCAAAVPCQSLLILFLFLFFWFGIVSLVSHFIQKAPEKNIACDSTQYLQMWISEKRQAHRCRCRQCDKIERNGIAEFLIWTTHRQNRKSKDGFSPRAEALAAPHHVFPL